MPAIRCPKCKTRYKVPASAGGRRTSCRNCGQKFRIPQMAAPAAPADPPPEPPGVGDDAFDELSALSSGEALDAPRAPAAAPLAAAPEAVPTAAEIEYAPGEDPERKAPADFVGYLRSVGRSALFPLRVGDLVSFIVLWLVNCIGDFVGAFGLCLALPGYIICYGWYWAYMLNIVQDAAGGEEDLPSMALTGGWWDDVVAPLLKMLLVTVVAGAPLAIFVVAGGLLSLQPGVAPGGAVVATTTVALGIALGALGFFIWPVLVLVMACGSFGSVFRLDLIFATIIKSFPAYLLTVIIVYISIGLSLWPEFLPFLLGDPEALGVEDIMTVFAIEAVTNLVATYSFVVAMRAIGLYYHHFKSRFAWDWG